MVKEKIWVTRREAFKITGTPRYVQRFIAAGWLKLIRSGGRGRTSLYTYKSLLAACSRVEKGEEPPLLPSEIKKKGNRKFEKQKQ